MPWKKNGEALAVDGSGNPIWIDDADASKETAVAGTVLATVQRANAEARQHRLDKEAAETKLKAFEGLDPTDARKAIETTKNIDAGKLIEAGKVDELKATLLADANKRIADAEKARDEAMTTAKNDKLAAAFASSGFIRDKLTLTPDLIQTMFGNRFDVRDGKVVAIDGAGNPITSQKNFGELASFDEAIGAIIDGHPSKANLLKGANNSGTGGDGNGGGDGSKRTVTRAQEAAMNPTEKAAFFTQVNEGKAQLVD